MNLVEVLNTIRDNASQMYRERIPEATQNNLEQIQSAMLDGNNVVVANEFTNMLLNKVVKSVIHVKRFSNPLKSLKKGQKPLGDTIEEIYNNFLKGEEYDSTGANLLKRNLPDTKVVYHRMNKQLKYKITVGRQELAKAFSSYEKLGSFITGIIQKLNDSAELDEFTNTKQLIKIALDNNALKVINVADPQKGEKEGKDFIKTVKIISGDMEFPNSNNNSYLEAQKVDDKEIITFSRKSEQILILDNPTNVNVSVDVLASLFNMSVAEFNDTRKIIIDAFPEKGVIGALVDEQFFQIYDDLVYFSSFRNEEGLYDNYYLHVWQTFAYSILVNGVVFKVAADTNSDSAVTKYTVTKNLKEGVTLSNNRINVAEGSSYSSKINGLAGGENVSVTMGGTDITDSAYVADLKAIDIETITGNVVITVA